MGSGDDKLGTMSTKYVEAIVTLSDPAGDAQAKAWFENHGLRTIPMRLGMLITGSESVFGVIFGVDGSFLRRDDIDRQLPVPRALAHWVESIVIRRIPTTHA